MAPPASVDDAALRVRGGEPGAYRGRPHDVARVPGREVTDGHDAYRRSRPMRRGRVATRSRRARSGATSTMTTVVPSARPRRPRVMSPVAAEVGAGGARTRPATASVAPSDRQLHEHDVRTTPAGRSARLPERVGRGPRRGRWRAARTTGARLRRPQRPGTVAHRRVVAVLRRSVPARSTRARNGFPRVLTRRSGGRRAPVARR